MSGSAFELATVRSRAGIEWMRHAMVSGELIRRHGREYHVASICYYANDISICVAFVERLEIKINESRELDVEALLRGLRRKDGESDKSLRERLDRQYSEYPG